MSGAHEGVVDEFLREELNYVVVENWGDAEEGVRLLKAGDGRATFLIHSDAQGVLFDEGAGAVNEPGLTPLRDAIKVLNGFGRSLESILPKLRHSYLVDDADEALRLASHLSARLFPHARGRVFPQRHGDRRQASQRRSAGAEARTARGRRPAGQARSQPGAGGDRSRNPDPDHRGTDRCNWRRISEQRRIAETDTANLGAALKQMEGEAQRIERRLQEWTMQAARNKDACEAKRQSIDQKREEAARLEAEHAQAEAGSG